jgi:hypothetical protein
MDTNSLSQNKREVLQKSEEVQSDMLAGLRQHEAKLKEVMVAVNEFRVVQAERVHEMRQFRQMVFSSFCIVEFSLAGVVVEQSSHQGGLSGEVLPRIRVGMAVSEFIGQEAGAAAWTKLYAGECYDYEQTVAEGHGDRFSIQYRFIPICNLQGKLLRIFMVGMPDW